MSIMNIIYYCEAGLTTPEPWFNRPTILYNLKVLMAHSVKYIELDMRS